MEYVKIERLKVENRELKEQKKKYYRLMIDKEIDIERVSQMNYWEFRNWKKENKA